MIQRITRLLKNTTRFFEEGLRAADADDDAKADFCDGSIHHAPFADRLEEAVRKDPALADLTNDKGERALDLACLVCRRAMQRALDDDVGVSEQVAKARALNDNARGIDRFGYRVYAKALHTIIDEAGAEPPVCVGLYAKWGSGKTFLINCIKQAFDPGIKEDQRTHDMRQWFERTPEDADAAEDKEIKDESYCAYTRAMARPRCEQLVRILTGVSLPAAPIYMPLWAEALARVATEMFEDICSEGLRKFAPRELAAVEGWCARPGCGRAVRQALIWGVVGAVVVVQLGVNVNVSRKVPGDAMPSRLFVLVLALVGFVLGAVASIAYTCRLTNLLCRICRNTKVAPQPEPEPEPETEYIFVDYNAWEYAGSDELWTGLIRNIYEQVEKRIER